MGKAGPPRVAKWVQAPRSISDSVKKRLPTPSLFLRGEDPEGRIILDSSAPVPFFSACFLYAFDILLRHAKFLRSFTPSTIVVKV